MGDHVVWITVTPSSINMSIESIPPHTQLLYSKTRVNMNAYFFSYFCIEIDCGYSLEPPCRRGSISYTHSLCFEQRVSFVFVLSQNKKIYLRMFFCFLLCYLLTNSLYCINVSVMNQYTTCMQLYFIVIHYLHTHTKSQKRDTSITEMYKNFP